MSTLRLVSLTLLAAGLAGCTPPPSSFTVTLGQADLQRAVEQRFPVTRESFLAAVTFQAPKVTLREGDRRVGLDLEAEVRLPLGSPLRGRVAALGDVAYDAETRSFFFRSPEVTHLDLPGLGEEIRGPAAEAVEALAGPVLESTPVYRLQDRTFPETAARALLRDVSVRDGRLHLTLGVGNP